IIKTLCSNVEKAQTESKKDKELLHKAEADLAEKAAELLEEKQKVQEYKEKLGVQKKSLDKYKLKSMRSDKTVADQALQLEAREKRIASLEAELAEQKRVVTSMGDVRTVNEQLARQLKKEKSKVRTVTTLNTQLASRIDGAKKASDRRHHQHELDGASNDTAMIHDTRSAGEDESFSGSIECLDDTSAEDALAEDVAAVRSAGIKPLSTTLRSRELPQSSRCGFTFEVPVAEFEATNIVDLTDDAPPLFSSLPEMTTASASNGNSSRINRKVNNPFAVDSVQPSTAPIPIKMPQALFSFRSPSIDTGARPIRSIKRPSKTAFSFSSDGLGGSRRSGTSVQAKISWGSKKS
ncbi:hypothetical protein EV175_001833, partial [Coemansia sp. RSA 1933]